MQDSENGTCWRCGNNWQPTRILDSLAKIYPGWRGSSRTLKKGCVKPNFRASSSSIHVALRVDQGYLGATIYWLSSQTLEIEQLLLTWAVQLIGLGSIASSSGEKCGNDVKPSKARRNPGDKLLPGQFQTVGVIWILIVARSSLCFSTQSWGQHFFLFSSI